ncbi:Uncharacterized protein PODLI_1B022634, partial [Podarcis lilfordi]
IPRLQNQLRHEPEGSSPVLDSQVLHSQPRQGKLRLPLGPEECSPPGQERRFLPEPCPAFLPELLTHPGSLLACLFLTSPDSLPCTQLQLLRTASTLHLRPLTRFGPRLSGPGLQRYRATPWVLRPPGRLRGQLATLHETDPSTPFTSLAPFSDLDEG